MSQIYGQQTEIYYTFNCKLQTMLFNSGYLSSANGTHSKRSNLNYFAIDLESLSYTVSFVFPIQKHTHSHGMRVWSAEAFAVLRNAHICHTLLHIYSRHTSFAYEQIERKWPWWRQTFCIYAAQRRNCSSDSISNCNDKLLTMLWHLHSQNYRLPFWSPPGFETPFFRLYLFWLPPSHAIYTVDLIGNTRLGIAVFFHAVFRNQFIRICGMLWWVSFDF